MNNVDFSYVSYQVTFEQSRRNRKNMRMRLEPGQRVAIYLLCGEITYKKVSDLNCELTVIRQFAAKEEPASLN